jgi:hypothetical protein
MQNQFQALLTEHNKLKANANKPPPSSQKPEGAPKPKEKKT